MLGPMVETARHYRVLPSHRLQRLSVLVTLVLLGAGCASGYPVTRMVGGHRVEGRFVGDQATLRTSKAWFSRPRAASMRPRQPTKGPSCTIPIAPSSGPASEPCVARRRPNRVRLPTQAGPGMRSRGRPRLIPRTRKRGPSGPDATCDTGSSSKPRERRALPPRSIPIVSSHPFCLLRSSNDKAASSKRVSGSMVWWSASPPRPTRTKPWRVSPGVPTTTRVAKRPSARSSPYDRLAMAPTLQASSAIARRDRLRTWQPRFRARTEPRALRPTLERSARSQGCGSRCRRVRANTRGARAERRSIRQRCASSGRGRRGFWHATTQPFRRSCPRCRPRRHRYRLGGALLICRASGPPDGFRNQADLG